VEEVDLTVESWRVTADAGAGNGARHVSDSPLLVHRV
jgi:hypothetical protein